jgi:prepilin-type N-terminal cleavage/methylation domain-containing protein
MQARGYTLVEIIVVICIVSLLLAIGTLKFSELFRRYQTEAQTRMISAELLQARANALYQRRETRVKFSRGYFEVYSSMFDRDKGVAPVTTQALRYPILVNSNVNADGENVDFDEKGIAQNLRSICIDGSDITGAVDSVVIGKTRVSIGKRKQGGICDDDQISLQ